MTISFFLSFRLADSVCVKATNCSFDGEHRSCVDLTVTLTLDAVMFKSRTILSKMFSMHFVSASKCLVALYKLSE